MTDKTKLKENVVKLLKSVVVTKKEGYQVSKLGYGYSQLVGTSIPYKELGYTSVNAFVSCLTKDIEIEIEASAKNYQSQTRQNLGHIKKLVKIHMHEKQSQTGLDNRQELIDGMVRIQLCSFKRPKMNIGPRLLVILSRAN